MIGNESSGREGRRGHNDRGSRGGRGGRSNPNWINASYDEMLFTGPQSHHLKCPICLDVMKDPVQCPTHGHTFCRHCILRHLNLSATCPTCREPLEKEKLLPNRLICSLIEDAEVYCFSTETLREDEIKNIERSEGKAVESCNWTGKLNEAKKHYDLCQFAEINCPHAGCNDILLRKSLPEHIGSCLHRLLPCKWCELKHMVDTLEAHLLACPKRPVPCPNSCLDANGAVLWLCPTIISQHRTQCTMESISCKFAPVGCKIKLLRKEMPMHEIDASAHIGYLLEALQTSQAALQISQAKIIELNRLQVIAQTKICELDKGRESARTEIDILKRDCMNTQLIFSVFISKLDKEINSPKINVSGYKFYINLLPNPNHVGWHSLFLYQLREINRVGSVEIILDVELVLCPSSSQYFKAVLVDDNDCSWGWDDFIETAVLKDERYIRDGQITLTAKIRVVL